VTEKIITLDGEPKKKVKGGFIRELKQELKKVSWVSKEELLRGAKLVVISTFVFGFCIYVVDLMIRSVLSGLHSIVYKVIG
jgi:preprotein translocase subunit SecE